MVYVWPVHLFIGIPEQPLLQNLELFVNMWSGLRTTHAYVFFSFLFSYPLLSFPLLFLVLFCFTLLCFSFLPIWDNIQ